MAATTTPGAHVDVIHIEGVQTAVPTRVVEPGRTRLVAVASPPLPADALQRRVRAVLYYRAGNGTGVGSDGTSAWEDGVWVKESLSEALADHPEMAGRLRRRGDGSWEVKLNDTGVRFLQATVDAPLDEFLAAKKSLSRREAALAPWTDVNADDPDMCPPFFMQLTRFQGDGGYAVGVSCSLMLVDPLSLARFLLSWARTHARMRSQSKATPHPMAQYLAYFQRPETSRKRLKSVPIDSFATDTDAATDTVLFRTSSAGDGHGHHRALVAACVEQASEVLGAAKASRFSVVAVDAPAAPAGGDHGQQLAGKTTIETCTAAVDGGGAGAELEAVEWSELGLEDLVLRDSKPVHVSYSIVTGGDEGLVVVMPEVAGSSLLVTATLPR